MAAETVEFAELPAADQVRILTVKVEELAVWLEDARTHLDQAQRQLATIAEMLRGLHGGDQHG